MSELQQGVCTCVGTSSLREEGINLGDIRLDLRFGVHPEGTGLVVKGERHCGKELSSIQEIISWEFEIEIMSVDLFLLIDVD